MPFKINFHIFLPIDGAVLVISLIVLLPALWNSFQIRWTWSKFHAQQPVWTHFTHLSSPWKLSRDLGNNIPKASEARPPASTVWLAKGLPFQPLSFSQWPPRTGGISGGQQHYTKLKHITGSQNSISLLVTLSKLSQAEYTWSLARVQNVLQIFSSKWLRSWMTNQAKLHSAKEIRQLPTYLQLKWPLKHNFWKIGEERDGLRSFCCCLQHPASLLLAGGTWRPEERNRNKSNAHF